jgi:parvulin-like peptidyl-prolyl isomerase
VGLALLVAEAARAQARGAVDTVDRIVAVVGKTPILRTHVDEEIFTRARGQQLPPPESAEFRAMRVQVLQELVDLELLYQQALTDTLVKVTDEQVHAAVDEQLRNIRAQYRTDEEWRQELRQSGFQTSDEYRNWLTEKQRRQLVTNEFLNRLRATGKLKPVIPTEREMRAYFDERKAQWQRAEAVTFRQIVVAPLPSAEAKARARQLVDSILAELRRGADFATAARRLSDDPVSRERGGSLGWFRRGVMHPAFEQVAFALRPGIVSDPVETPYGFHLIQVERAQPAEVSARHILIAPEVRPEDLDSARVVAERLRAVLVAGGGRGAEGASFDSLQRVHHDPLEPREMREFPVQQLPQPYAATLAGLAAGEFAPVTQLPGVGEVGGKFAVIQLVERRPAGEPRYEDVRDQIRVELGERLAIRRYLDRLRGGVYAEVREP